MTRSARLEGGERAVQGGGDVAGEQMVAVANHLAAGDHDRGDVGGGGGEHQVVNTINSGLTLTW